MQGVEIYASGISFVDGGDWLRYDGVDFGAGVTQFFVRIAVPAEFAGRQIEVRLDELTGERVGVLTVAATASWDEPTTQQVAIDPVSGVHDLYLRFTGGDGVGNIDWFRFAPVSAPAPSEPIPAALFGMHLHRAASGGSWPSIPFAGWRLHDADGLFWHQLRAGAGQLGFCPLRPGADAGGSPRRGAALRAGPNARLGRRAPQCALCLRHPRHLLRTSEPGRLARLRAHRCHALPRPNSLLRNLERAGPAWLLLR